MYLCTISKFNYNYFNCKGEISCSDGHSLPHIIQGELGSLASNNLRVTIIMGLPYTEVILSLGNKFEINMLIILVQSRSFDLK